MAAKNGKTLNHFINGPYRAGAPLFPFLLPIGRHTISQYEPLRKRSPFRRLRVDHIWFSPKFQFRKAGLSACWEKRLTPPHAMETNEADDPVNTRQFTGDTLTALPEDASDLVQDPQLVAFVWARHRDPLREPLWTVDNKHRAKLPGNLSNIKLSGQKVMLINGAAETQDEVDRVHVREYSGICTDARSRRPSFGAP
jgi:hypothetical protein